MNIHSFARITHVVIASGLVAVPTLTLAGDLTVSFAEQSSWDGKTVPSGQQCDRFKGAGHTPPLSISGLPDGTEVVVVEYSDRDSQKMNNGGHGKIGMRVQAGSTELSFPSVPGHTFNLPSEVFLVKEHRNPDWATAGAYMPPCSGGSGNTYYLTVIAARIKSFDKKKFKKIEKVKLIMGRY